MKRHAFLLLLLLLAPISHAQLRNRLDGDDTVTPEFFTVPNSDQIVVGLNLHANERFTLSLIPGESFGKGFLALQDAAEGRAKLGLGPAATLDVPTITRAADLALVASTVGLLSDAPIKTYHLNPSGDVSQIVLPATAENGAVIRLRIVFPSEAQLLEGGHVGCTVQVTSGDLPLFTQSSAGLLVAAFAEFSFHPGVSGGWLLDQAQFTP